MTQSMKRRLVCTFILLVFICRFPTNAQQIDSLDNQTVKYKNVIRYNLSGALLFGIDRYIVLGYERIIGKNQSLSFNFGRSALPKIISIITDSLNLSNDVKNTGKNVSLDWRFYLAKENKFAIPHGLYVGPYYSFNKYEKVNQYTFKRSNGSTQTGNTNTKLDLHSIGGELGYQLILWKRMTLDLLLIGPGISFYRVKAKFEGSLTDADRQQLRQAVQQVLTQRFPGMNYVLSDKELDGTGTLKTTSLGFRYIIHIGFLF